jgi:hypothetical protein
LQSFLWKVKMERPFNLIRATQNYGDLALYEAVRGML